MAAVFLQLQDLMRQVPGAELNPDLRAMLFVAHVTKIEDKSGYGMRAEWFWHCTTVSEWRAVQSCPRYCLLHSVRIADLDSAVQRYVRLVDVDMDIEVYVCLPQEAHRLLIRCAAWPCG